MRTARSDRIAGAADSFAAQMVRNELARIHHRIEIDAGTYAQALQ